MSLLRIFSAKQLSVNQQVNRIGKYLYKHLDGATKAVKSSNMIDVYTVLLYSEKDNLAEVSEMLIDINVTTYQNKIRVNVVEVTPEERTLGFDLYLPEEVEDLSTAYKIIFNKVIQRCSKAYEDYEFLI